MYFGWYNVVMTANVSGFHSASTATAGATEVSGGAAEEEAPAAPGPQAAAAQGARVRLVSVRRSARACFKKRFENLFILPFRCPVDKIRKDR